MSDCHTAKDKVEPLLTPLGKAIRRFLGIPCVECTYEITEQINHVRSALVKYNGKSVGYIDPVAAINLESE
jgi:hypothetical protein